MEDPATTLTTLSQAARSRTAAALQADEAAKETPPLKPSLSKRRSGAPPSTGLKTRRSHELKATASDLSTVMPSKDMPRSERADTLSPPPSTTCAPSSPKGGSRKRVATDAADDKQRGFKETSRRGDRAPKQPSPAVRPAKKAKAMHVQFSAPETPEGAYPSKDFAKHAAVLRRVPDAIEWMLRRVRDLEAEVDGLRTREANVKANAKRSEMVVSEQLAKIASSLTALTEVKQRVEDGAMFADNPVSTPQ